VLGPGGKSRRRTRIGEDVPVDERLGGTRPAGYAGSRRWVPLLPVFVAVVGAGVLLLMPMDAEGPNFRKTGIADRVAYECSDRPIAALFGPIAGSPLWEINDPQVGPCLHAAFLRFLWAEAVALAGILMALYMRRRLNASTRARH
jgi:hypothetical protein